MFKHIAGTTLTKIAITALGFLTVIMATRHLGAEQYGNISMFLLSLSLLQLVCGIAGGPALVYLVPRSPLPRLLAVSFTWAIIVHVLAYVILFYTQLFQKDMLHHLIMLSFLFYLNSFAYTVLLGKQKIQVFNLILLLQAASLLAVFGVNLLMATEKSFLLYIHSLYWAYGLATLTGWAFIARYFSEESKTGLFSGWAKMIRYGGFLQIANALQLLNYRLSYFLMDNFMGRAFLGIYTSGVQLSEGVWIFGKSFALVQYSSISNNQDPEYARITSIRLIKIIAAIVAFCLAGLLVLPAWVYAYVFGEGFEKVKTVIIYMAPGIFTLSLSQIFSHYFSGTGKQQHNAIGSAIGLIITLACGIFLIPRFGLAGAGITASLAYTGSTIYQWIMFIEITGSRFRDFLYTTSDLHDLREKLKRKKKEKSGSKANQP